MRFALRSGYCASIKAGQLGLKTVCIEKRGALGGTCLNVGCIPSKTLLNIAHKYADAQKNFKKLGIEVTGLKMNWGKFDSCSSAVRRSSRPPLLPPQLWLTAVAPGGPPCTEKAQKKKDVVITMLTKGIEGLLKKNKVDYVKGEASFVDANTLKVVGADGKESQISAKSILIATGSKVAPFRVAQYDEKTILSSTGALSLQKVPKNMVIVGGGVIGIEMAYVYSSLGAEVTIVEFLDRIIPPADADVSRAYKQILEKKKIKVFTSHAVVEIQKTGAGAKVGFQPVKGGQKTVLEVEKVLISTGRVPCTDGLNAKGVNLLIDKYGRIEINSQYQTSVPNIYAIGDVVKGPMLAHKAEEEGVAVVSMLKGLKPHVNYDLIPSVVYSTPEIAWVGKTEEELKAASNAHHLSSPPNWSRLLFVRNAPPSSPPVVACSAREWKAPPLTIHAAHSL